MAPAKRKTPTQAGGGASDGVGYTNAVNDEVTALWQSAALWLTNVAGTANAITAQTDAAQLDPLTALVRPMAFWLVPAVNNPGAATIAIDGLSDIAIVDANGNPLAEDALQAGRALKLVHDGTSLRVASGGGSGGASGGSAVFALNGGRLTPATGTPVVNSTPSTTTLYWTPYESNQIALFDGVDTWVTVASPEKSIKLTDTQTGTTTNGAKTISGLTDTSQLVPGMKISGTGVGAGAVIDTIDSPTQVSASVNSTASGSASITFKCPANTGYDIFGKLVSGALKLLMVARSSLFTETTLTTQDGVPVKSGDTTMRHLGAFGMSATDGQLDYLLLGRYRLSIWNRYNRLYRYGAETFSASGTWWKALGLVRVEIEAAGAGGAGGSAFIDGPGGDGGHGGLAIKTLNNLSLAASETVTASGTASFGAHCSSNAGGAGPASSGPGSVASGHGAHGTASGGDINLTGSGSPGGSGGIANSSSSTAAQAGTPARVVVREMIEI